MSTYGPAYMGGYGQRQGLLGPATQQQGNISADQINGWLAANPGAADTQIRSAMDTYGVSPMQMSDATGVGLNDVWTRYTAAGNQGGQPAGGGGYGSQGYTQNPYFDAQADDIGRRTQDFLNTNQRGVRGNAILAGGFGGSAHGIADGRATAGAADYLQGNLAGLHSGQYNQDQNRGLQQYGLDQSFYTAQRGQDQNAFGLGMQAYNLANASDWSPIGDASGAMSPYTGFGSTTQSGGQDSDWQKALSTGLGIYGTGLNNKWWGG